MAMVRLTLRSARSALTSRMITGFGRRPTVTVEEHAPKRTARSHGVFAPERRVAAAGARARLALAIGVAILAGAAPSVARANEAGVVAQRVEAQRVVAQPDRPPGAPVALGTIEPDHKFPWVVSVSNSDVNGKGVLIAPRWVLTAAHVVEPARFRGATVAFDRTDPVSGERTQGEKETGPNSVFIHEDYLAGNADADIALVRLPAPFAPHPHLQPAELPLTAAALGQVGTVANHSHSTTLPSGQVAVLRGPIVAAFNKTFDGRSPTASLCKGDSGSGFVTTSGELNVVTGIVFKAYLKGCETGGQADNPFEAVDVHKYLGWIRSISKIGLNDNAEFYATDGAGGITPLRSLAWDKTWDLIVPGQFGGDGRTDLLFYDRETGRGEFYATDGAGKITLLRAHAWDKTWDLIVPGQFNGDGWTDLLFYDREGGVGLFVATDGAGGAADLRQHAWDKTWDLIVDQQLGGDSWTDLLFYRR